ncbi:MAG TPA: DUF1573 domain-containing protein [Planctomycetaceae bacterium]|jgi:hypothetical protein|nr:DUF1573 domain-containing protein [Planctomycetaceae bacterium]
MNRTLRCCSLCVLPLILAATPGLLPAQGIVQQQIIQPQVVADPNDWAKAMFDSTSHDFGVVARGAEVVHRFRVKNLYKEDVQISTVTTSCGCTAPQFDQTPVKSGGETYVTISMDTLKFQHLKTSTVTVQFAQPRFAEVKIPVQVYIRSDVVLTPGSINFGAVGTGEKVDRSIEIAYAGRPDWKIVKVNSGDSNVDAKVVETSRNGGQVNYRLDVSLLSTAPVGLLRKQMTLVTDDASGSEIPVIVQARVEGDVTVTPSVVQLGTVAPGAETTKTVLLRSHKPFVIEKVECDSNRQAFRMPALGKEARPVHVLSLAFTAPNQIGQFTEKFIVTISGRPEPIYFTAQGDIQGSSTQALNAVPATVFPQGQ